MGAKSTVPFPDGEVLPGDHVTLELPMTAPDTAGTYKSYWMLQSDNGVLFALGPDGRAWFWVEISAED